MSDQARQLFALAKGEKRTVQKEVKMKGEPAPKTGEILNPWVIMHQPADKLECILGMPDGADHRCFGMVIADIVRNVAAAFEVDEADVMQWVNKEIDDPTTVLTGGRIN